MERSRHEACTVGAAGEWALGMLEEQLGSEWPRSFRGPQPAVPTELRDPFHKGHVEPSGGVVHPVSMRMSLTGR
jgi:hypothetical protein